MKRRVAIVAPTASPFVVRDINLLSDDFEVSLSLFPVKIGTELFIYPLRMLINIIRSDVIISWFANLSYYPLILSKMFNKKLIVIVAGYDVAKLSRLDYGALLKKKNISRVKWVLSNASAVTAVDSGLLNNIIEEYSDHFDTVIIPTGYDPIKYTPRGEKENFVLTVCNANSKRAFVKGVDVFIECALKMPGTKFMIIGLYGEALNLFGEIPLNVTISGPCASDELIPYYQRAKVYCQLSMREGLPNALCEAMLCGCIPVGSDVQGVRTAIGDNGLLVPYGDISATCRAIEKALVTKDCGGRERIMNLFSESNRKEKLLALITKLI